VLLFPFQAFRSIKCFLSKLEKVSENPELALEAGKLKWEYIDGLQFFVFFGLHDLSLCSYMFCFTLVS